MLNITFSQSTPLPFFKCLKYSIIELELKLITIFLSI